MNFLLFLKISGFILMALSGTGIMYYLGKHDVLKRAAKKAYRTLDEAAVEGARAAKREIMFEDTAERKGFASLLDGVRKKYVYSRLGKKLSLSFEIWMVIVAASACAMYFLILLITKSVFKGLAAIGLYVTVIYLIVFFLAYRNYKIVDAALIKMVDLLSNFTATNGEITGIFHKISRYLPAPLSDVLDECYYDASTCGDTSLALFACAEKVEHPLFKDLIRNIEICVNYTASFDTIVNSARKLIAKEQRAKKERRALANANLINMVIVNIGMFASLFIVDMLGTNMWDILFDTTVGHGCLMILAVIYMIFGISVITVEK